MVIEFDSLDDARLDVFLRLTEVELRNRLEPEKGVFVAESAEVIGRALDAGFEPVAALMPAGKLAKLGALVARLEAAAPGFPVFTAPDALIEQLTGYELTRGVLCAFRRPALVPLGELLAGARCVVVLEDITNHTNIGAIFRSAAALGADAVVVGQGCCDPLYRRAIRVSMGTVFQVPWTRCGLDTAACMSELNAAGFTSCALALRDESLPLGAPALQGLERVALVMGTEGAGLRTETIAACTHTVRIPMARGVDSLNVAAATAVALWALNN